MTSYRTGWIVGYEEGRPSIRTAPRRERHEDRAPFSSDANELPSVALTTPYGRDYRLGCGLGLLERGKTFDLGVDAQRRESPMDGRATNGFMGRATLRW